MIIILLADGPGQVWGLLVLEKGLAMYLPHTQCLGEKSVKERNNL